jgi:acetyl-CoA synthetase
MAMHNFSYPLGHIRTAKYWQCVEPDGLHLTVSDTGWAKASWGKIYGQWLMECAIMVYDYDRFNAQRLLDVVCKYKVTTFCAPPTIFRFIIHEDLKAYDLSFIRRVSMAGEALNPEVFERFRELTGLTICEGFGQSETTCCVGTPYWLEARAGSMGKEMPGYRMVILDAHGDPAPAGVVGEIAFRSPYCNGPAGLFCGYYNDEAKTSEAWHDGYYRTGDTAWKDEEGYYYYVGRVDDLIKSSGYRIGPFEVESVLMEHPSVLECAVTGTPDPIRGQVVKATIVLTKNFSPSEELKKEIQEYVKTHTAPYKYPRVIEFTDALPKTTSGKIQRNLLRQADQKAQE